jgi:hypothetical protein
MKSDLWENCTCDSADVHSRKKEISMPHSNHMPGSTQNCESVQTWAFWVISLIGFLIGNPSKLRVAAVCSCFRLSGWPSPELTFDLSNIGINKARCIVLSLRNLIQTIIQCSVFELSVTVRPIQFLNVPIVSLSQSPATSQDSPIVTKFLIQNLIVLGQIVKAHGCPAPITWLQWMILFRRFAIRFLVLTS